MATSVPPPAFLATEARAVVEGIAGVAPLPALPVFAARVGDGRAVPNPSITTSCAFARPSLRPAPARSVCPRRPRDFPEFAELVDLAIAKHPCRNCKGLYCTPSVPFGTIRPNGVPTRLLRRNRSDATESGELRRIRGEPGCHGSALRHAVSRASPCLLYTSDAADE